MAEFRRPPNPNPTLRSSTVEFAVGKPGFVELSVYDVRGARVRTIQAGPMSPGVYTRTWDGRTDRFSDAQPGMYFFVLNTSDGVVSRRIGLIH